jgi:hypothetical protein
LQGGKLVAAGHEMKDAPHARKSNLFFFWSAKQLLVGSKDDFQKFCKKLCVFYNNMNYLPAFFQLFRIFVRILLPRALLGQYSRRILLPRALRGNILARFWCNFTCKISP